jgi:hypothetical protein
MEKLQNLTFEDFIQLVNYLESATEGAAMAAIGNFFPELSALQELELGYIVDTKDEASFERFRNEHPDLVIDPSGKTEPSEKNYWEIKEKALNHAYDSAFNSLSQEGFQDRSKSKINTQIYNAKTLAALKNMEYSDPSIYPFKRKLFIDKNQELSNREFNRIEDILKSIGLEPSKFMIYVLNYCKDKKYDSFNFFLDHLFSRIELLSDDKEKVSEYNKSFYDSINEVCNKNK